MVGEILEAVKEHMGVVIVMGEREGEEKDLRQQHHQLVIHTPDQKLNHQEAAALIGIEHLQVEDMLPQLIH